MGEWSFGDGFFILLVSGLIYGILRVVNRPRTSDRQPDASPQDQAGPFSIPEMLEKFRIVAVVGASNNPERASHHVMEYLVGAGYTVYPVNPSEQEILGLPAYATLADLPASPEIVDVFRAPEHVPEIARQAIAAGARVLWLQEGVVSEEGAAIARQAGLKVVMDKCMLKEHKKLVGSGSAPAVHEQE